MRRCRPPPPKQPYCHLITQKELVAILHHTHPGLAKVDAAHQLAHNHDVHALNHLFVGQQTMVGSTSCCRKQIGNKVHSRDVHALNHLCAKEAAK